MLSASVEEFFSNKIEINTLVYRYKNQMDNYLLTGTPEIAIVVIILISMRDKCNMYSFKFPRRSKDRKHIVNCTSVCAWTHDQ